MVDAINKSAIVAGVALVIASAMLLYWQFYIIPEPVIPPVRPPAALYTSSSAYASLGENIYRKSKNPIENKVPEAPAPKVNPIDEAYKNPFE